MSWGYLGAVILQGTILMPADPNRVILTGENPFIRLSVNDGDPLTTNASFWRIITCPAGRGMSSTSTAS